MKTTAMQVLLTAALFCAAPACAVTFDFATVGNAGNAADPQTGFGSVSYSFAISKTEVTNAQYVEFLNAVASTDSFGGSDPTLYSTDMGTSTWGGITRSGTAGSYTYAVKSPAIGLGPGGSDYSYDNKPVVFVSFLDAMRFTNWLHNGQESGGTETGTYTIDNGFNEIRTSGARFWIPSEDEWYKAAYYDPNAGGGIGTYYDYPTSTNAPPNNYVPTADTGNSANFFDSAYTTGSVSYPMTDVGAYSLSESPYGTFDQGGNVLEWNEGDIVTFSRGLRGGEWGEYSFLDAYHRILAIPLNSTTSIGFRIATVPEPRNGLLGLMAVLGPLLRITAIRRQTFFGGPRG